MQPDVQLFELGQEAAIRRRDLPCHDNSAKGIKQAHRMPSHEIRSDDCRRARHPGGAVHEDGALSERLVKERGGRGTDLVDRGGFRVN